MASIRIEDLPPGENLTAEEREQLFGAGRRSFRPLLEGLETRQLLSGNLGGSLTPGLLPADTSHVGQSHPVNDMQILPTNQQQQVIAGDVSGKLEQGRQGPRHVVFDPEGAAWPGPAPRRLLAANVGQSHPVNDMQVLPMNQQQQQVANLAGKSVIDALKAGANWIIYEPKTNLPGQQVGEAQIRSELQMLYQRGFRGIVTYAFDNGREEIPRIAKEVGFQQVIAGIWARDNYAVEKANLTADRLEHIDGLVVGNEIRLMNVYGLDELTRRVNEIKALSGGKPTTTADAWNKYVDELGLMKVGDWVFPNLHPFYERGCAPAHNDPAKAMEFMTNVLKEQFNAQKTGGKFVALHESWWPSAQDGPIGDPTYQGAASAAKQKQYFELLNQSGVAFVYGEAFDQSWKGGEGDVRGMGNFGVHWGLWRDANSPKDVVDFINTGYRPGYQP